MFAYIIDMYEPERWGVVEYHKIVEEQDTIRNVIKWRFKNPIVIRNDSHTLHFGSSFHSCDFNLYRYETIDKLVDEHFISLM